MLKQPLGAWIVDQNKIRKKYGCYRTHSKIYRIKDSDIQVRDIHVIAGTEWASLSQATAEEIPDNAVPCLQSFAGWLYTTYNKIDKDLASASSIQNTSNILKSIKHQTITGHPVSFMRKVIQQELIESYFKKKLGEVYEKIQWEVYKKAIKLKRVKGALLKMIHGVCPTQAHMVKIRLTAHAICPCCQKDQEDTHHILICDERRHNTIIRFREEIQKALPEVKNKENLFKQIIESTMYQSNKMDGEWIFEDQDQIGWDNMLKGYVSLEWKTVMETLNPRKKWQDTMSIIVVSYWKTWLAMWRHRNDSMDSNTRYCAQMTDDNNKLSLHIIYTLRNMLSKAVNRILKRNIQEHLKFPREQVSDWLSMYRSVIKNIIDTKDPDLWQKTREEWIVKYSSEE